MTEAIKRADIADEPEGFTSFCWCGEREAWFSDLMASHCAGTGYIDCFCGGDFCVCHNHGGTECPGCDDCGGAEDSE